MRVSSRVAANVVMTSFALLAGYAGRAAALEFVLVLGLIGGARLSQPWKRSSSTTHVHIYSDIPLPKPPFDPSGKGPAPKVSRGLGLRSQPDETVNVGVGT